MSRKNISRLPFVVVEGTNKNYWSPAQETGVWGADNKVGRAYADALVSECRDGELGMILGRVGEAIVRSGRYGGIEVGFFNRLGEIAACAVAGNYNTSDMAVAA